MAEECCNIPTDTRDAVVVTMKAKDNKVKNKNNEKYIIRLEHSEGTVLLKQFKSQKDRIKKQKR